MKNIILYTLLFAVLEYINACSSDYGVSVKEKKAIVNKHNELRLKIVKGEVSGQPRGINLKRMVWDDHLARQAQDIANTCTFHRTEVSDSRWEVGQNLYIQSGNKLKESADWNASIDHWFNEHDKYTYSTKYVFNKATGHYTQVVWANTTHIGCGYNYYHKGNRYHKLYVCNYGPVGNILGDSVYIVGDHGCHNLC